MSEESIAKRTGANVGTMKPTDIRKLFEAALSNDKKLKTTVDALVVTVTAIADKLDADTGITDTDYGDEVTAAAVEDFDLKA